MPLPADGPCSPWCTWVQVTRCTSTSLEALTDEVQQAELIAEGSSLLYELTQRRYPGVCEATRSFSGCGCAVPDRCSCDRGDRLDLGSKWPVADVLDVVVDGVPVDPLLYRVDNWRWLRRLDGGSWPRCADLTDPAGFQVTWEYGRMPSSSLARACAQFVAELAKHCLTGKCALPERITNMSREGVQFTILDSGKYLDDGKIGFFPVDRAVMASNRGRKARPGIFIPGARRRVAAGTDVPGGS